MMKENVIRAILNENKPSISTRLWCPWPEFVEALGTLKKFDYYEFVAEYVPFSQQDMSNLCRASELHDMGSMIKVDFMNRGYVAQRAISAGFQSVLFSDHHTADEVRETIQMVKPADPISNGRFGYPNSRFIGMQSHLPCMSHVDRINDIVICFMIEKESIVEQIDEVCAIPGVDMVTFGPNDYCITHGWNPVDHKKEWLAAERHVYETALKHGVQPRVQIDNMEEAKYYVDMGVKHFCVGDQMKTLKTFWNEQGIKYLELKSSIR